MNNTNEMKVVNLPMCTQKKYMKDKKYDYKTLAIMTLYSKFTPIEEQHKTGNYEPYRFVYKNKIIEFTDEIENLSNKKIGTIINNMRKLSQIENGLVTATKNRNEQIIYYITYENELGRGYTTIPEEMLRRLIQCGNGNMIKAYLLIKYLCEDEKRRFGNSEKKITNNYICEEIGLSSKSKTNIQCITEITNALEEWDFINKRYVKLSEKGVKTYIYYSLLSYEEWMSKKKDRENMRYK